MQTATIAKKPRIQALYAENPAFRRSGTDGARTHDLSRVRRGHSQKTQKGRHFSGHCIKLYSVCTHLTKSGFQD